MGGRLEARRISRNATAEIMYVMLSLLTEPVINANIGSVALSPIANSATPGSSGASSRAMR